MNMNRQLTDAQMEPVVTLGVQLAAASIEDGYLTVGGIPKSKTNSQRRDDSIRLETVSDVLDRMRWYGDWGQTVHAVKMELIRRAKETRR
jgi:hypothetical protein